MNLLQTLREQQTPQRYTMTDYYEWLVSYAVGGNSYTLPVQQSYGAQPAETVEGTFAGYVQNAYKHNGIIFACMLSRLMVFSEARFLWLQRARNAQPERRWTDASLENLEHPWPGGVTSDLLMRMILDADLAGNFYAVRIDDEIVRLRPDFVNILLAPRYYGGGQVGFKRVGYTYQEQVGIGAEKPNPVAFLPDEVVHFAPSPDPLANYRGMSWLTPIIRELQTDSAATSHKQKFFEHAATPNLVVKLDPTMTPDLAEAFKEKLDERHMSAENAYKTLYVGGAADVQVVGATMQQMDFRSVQGAGETRIAAAAGVPPIIVGLSEGLAAGTYNNYGQARRRFADGTIRPLWRNAAASLEMLFPPPNQAAELWYDEASVPFLREDTKDAAGITQTQSSAVQTLVNAGYEPDAVVAAVLADDLTGLAGHHTGLYSVQLQPPGTETPPAKMEIVAGKSS